MGTGGAFIGTSAACEATLKLIAISTTLPKRNVFIAHPRTHSAVHSNTTGRFWLLPAEHSASRKRSLQFKGGTCGHLAWKRQLDIYRSPIGLWSTYRPRAGQLKIS